MKEGEGEGGREREREREGSEIKQIIREVVLALEVHWQTWKAKWNNSNYKKKLLCLSVHSSTFSL